MRALVALAVLLSASSACAQERTACAESFSERLAELRAAFEEHVRRHPDADFAPPRNAANEACREEDAQHRIALVPQDPRAVWEQEVLCYGNTRASCTSARATLAEYYRTRRARARGGN